jgi:hypothetical protein
MIAIAVMITNLLVSNASAFHNMSQMWLEHNLGGAGASIFDGTTAGRLG